MKIPEFAEQPELDPWVWLKNWLIEAEDEEKMNRQPWHCQP